MSTAFKMSKGGHCGPGRGPHLVRDHARRANGCALPQPGRRRGLHDHQGASVRRSAGRPSTSPKKAGGDLRGARRQVSLPLHGEELEVARDDGRYAGRRAWVGEPRAGTGPAALHLCARRDRRTLPQIGRTSPDGWADLAPVGTTPGSSMPPWPSSNQSPRTAGVNCASRAKVSAARPRPAHAGSSWRWLWRRPDDVLAVLAASANVRA